MAFLFFHFLCTTTKASISCLERKPFASKPTPNDADLSEPRDTHCVWFFGIVGHDACPILLRTRVHTFFLSDPSKAASLMPCGDHNTYWAVALSGDDIQVCPRALSSVLCVVVVGLKGRCSTLSR